MWSAVRNAGNGRSTGPSIDEFVHQRISDGRPALRLGVRAANYVSNWTRCSFNDAGNPINPRNDPYKARDDVFSGFTPTEPGEDPEQDRQFELRSSVLNYAKSKLTHMNNRLSPADQVRLSGHISGFNAIKNAPPEAPTLACSMAAVDAWERGVDPDRSANYPKVLRMQMELVLAAFSCDAARVATLQLGQSNSTIHHTWADSDADAEHHSITHYNSGYSNPRRSRVLANIYRWHAEQFAWLIAEMKRMGLLENTVVAWSSEMGEGDSHASTEIPWVLFGDGGGYFRTGSYANYLQTSGAHIPGERGVSHCDVLTSLCESMGAPPPGGKFGDPNSGYGPLKLIT